MNRKKYSSSCVFNQCWIMCHDLSWQERRVFCSVTTCRFCHLLVSPLSGDDLQEWSSNSQAAVAELISPLHYGWLCVRIHTPNFTNLWVHAYESRRLCGIESDHEAHGCSASQSTGKWRCLTNQRVGASGYPTNSPELDRSITSLCEPYIRHWIMQTLPIPMKEAKAEKRVPSVRFLSEGEREKREWTTG